ncbi:hypothetical protein P280DRAFT_366032, partial [Massarina eburnea CBS 473.64]
MARRSAGFVSKRPHKKSRGGCLTCKKKKVKCDETSPSCGYCALRKVDCIYPQEPKSSPDKSPSPIITQQTNPIESEFQDVEFSSPTCLIPALHTSSGQLSTIDIHLLDHYKKTVWRTMSYREDDNVVYLNRDWVPSKAIKTDYLLYSVLSVASGHLNTLNPDIRTKAINLHYRQQAMSAYAKALNNITADNYETILMTSLYMMGMVQAPEQPCTDETYLEWMCALFSMMQGLRVLAGLKWAVGIEKLEIYPIFRRELNPLPPPPML